MRSYARSYVAEKQVADKLTEAKQHKENAEESELEVVISNEEEPKRNEPAHADWKFTADEILNARRGSLRILVNDCKGEGDHRDVNEGIKDGVEEPIAHQVSEADPQGQDHQGCARHCSANEKEAQSALG